MALWQDIRSGEWVNHPKLAKCSPYLRLMRLHHPIGIWLLMWPCWWSIILSSKTPRFDLLALFFIGSIIMRGAACIINDIWDKDFDAQVERTKLRPLASGELTVNQAYKLLFLLLCLAFIIWLYLPVLARMVALFSLIPVVIYPVTKRYTHLPQLFLGFTINLGVLIGSYAAAGTLTGPSWLIYLGCVFWTFGYDTIYAHQDKEYDAVLGIKSSALLFGDNPRKILSGLYQFAGAFWFFAALIAHVSTFFYIFFVLVVYHLFRQLDDVDFNNPESCLATFKSNVNLGFYMFLACIAAVYL